jgi:uncharacterized repeat protein (TIGR03833 family)
MNLNATPQPNMYRANIKPGMVVDVILKKDQKTGKCTRGVVKHILTSAAYHTRGIKVQMESYQIGRVQKIIVSEDLNL